MVIYVYAAEILTDKGMAISSVVHWGTNTLMGFLPIFGLTFARIGQDYIILDEALTLYFFFFSGVSILGFFLVTIFVKETKGKSRKEITKDFQNNDFDALAITNSIN